MNNTNVSESETVGFDFPVTSDTVKVNPPSESKVDEYKKLIRKLDEDRRKYEQLLIQELESPEVKKGFRDQFDMLMASSRIGGNPWRFLEYIGYEKKVKLNPDGTVKERTRTIITPELEQKVKGLKEEGRTGKQIQRETGLSESSVSKILNGTRDVVGRN